MTEAQFWWRAISFSARWQKQFLFSAISNRCIHFLAWSSGQPHRPDVKCWRRGWLQTGHFLFSANLSAAPARQCIPAIKTKWKIRLFLSNTFSSAWALLYVFCSFWTFFFRENGSKLLALTENNVFKNNLPKEHAL